MKRVRAVVSGTVQGVFYRASLCEEANSLGLRGWVQNLPTGEVEWLAEGPEDKLNKLIEWSMEGPETADVSGVLAHWRDATEEFSTFEIRR